MTLEIKGRENGPYLIPGSANYSDPANGEQTTSGTIIALCRCGGSNSKPFCDGTHRKIGFEAPAVILHLDE